MNKKLIISLSVLFSVVVVALILFWTLFALSSVSVQFHSTKINLQGLSDKEIVEAGGFKYGECVLFEGKKGYEKNLKNATKNNKLFAYIRVLNIETVFPNKMIIHVAEREELFSVVTEEHTYVCDRDLRVLRIDPEEQPNTIDVNGLKIKSTEISEGDFLDVEQGAIKDFYSLMLQTNRDVSELVGKFKSLDVSTYTESETEYYSFKLTTNQDRVFVINNPKFAFSEKIKLMFSFESTLFGKSQDGQVLDAGGNQIYVKKYENEYLFVSKEKEPVAQALTTEFLSHCAIKVDNLPLDKHLHRTEKDIYASLLEL